MSEHAGWTDEARGLLAKMLQGRGCGEFGVAITPKREERCALCVTHDRRGAPYVVDDTNTEIADTLVSFSDEGTLYACAWMKLDRHSPLVGLGIDLVDTSEFREAGRGDFLARVLLFDDEARLARELHPEDASLGYAFAFGAKEAAFKATSQPLRAWCQQHDGDLFFELRDFALTAGGTREKGVRHAADIFSTLGIEHIELGHVRLGDLVFVAALALGTNK